MPVHPKSTRNTPKKITMKENWEIKKLDEVCETINGLWTGKKSLLLMLV